MKTLFKFSMAAYLSLFIMACGSSSESRKMMDQSAKRMSDSIRALVDSSWQAPLSVFASDKISINFCVKKSETKPFKKAHRIHYQSLSCNFYSGTSLGSFL